MLLPHFEPECFDVKENFACDYPEEGLIKAYNVQTGEKYPDFAEFVSFFGFNGGRDQEDIMARFLYGSSKDWNNVTCNWIKEDIRKGQDSLFSKWKQFLDSKFVGESWQGIDPVSAFTLCECGVDNKQKIVRYFTLPNSLEGVTFLEDDQPCSDKVSFSTYSSRWQNQDYETQVVDTTGCHFVHRDSDKGRGILLIALVSMLIILGLGFLIYYYRETQIMYASSQRTMAVFLTGAFFLNASYLVYVGYSPTRGRCFIRIALLTFGVTLFTGSLLIKQFYLYGLFYASPFNSRNATRTAILKRQILILTTIPVILIICWSALVSNLTPR
uniref:G-protein coupled receptors family 3 profile domain-containing protein n=2 Tax=Aplanochytrium stocchinoi TaxID=215587 RepID=A0A6S8D172_9STRA